MSTMPRQRLRLLLALTIAATFATTTLHALSAQSPSTQASAASPSSDLDSLSRQALEEGEAGKNEDAIRDFKTVLSSRPDWKEGRWNLGTLEYSTNRFSEAEETFTRVVSFAPNLGLAWAMLGLSEYENKHYDQAFDHLQKAHVLGILDDPQIERVGLYHLALLLNRASQFDRASTLLKEAFMTQAQSSQVKVAMGLAVLRVPLLPEQVTPAREALVLAAGSAALAGPSQSEAFQSLLAVNPDVPYLNLAAALAASASGKDQEAATLLMRETVLSPKSSAPWIELSRIQAKQSQWDLAVKSARKAVSLEPSSPSAHQALATALASSGQRAESDREQRLASSEPGSALPAEPRILSFYGNSAESSTSPSGSQALDELWGRAMRQYSDARYEEAATNLALLLESRPENGTAWAVLGLCDYARHDYDSALIHLQRGATLGLSGSTQSLQLARVTYGTLLTRAGQFDQAAEILASAQASGPLLERAEAAAGLALLRHAELADSTKLPQNLLRTAGRISLLLQQSKYDEAFPLFQRLLQQYPATPFLHYAYGTALLALSEFDQAAAQMQAEMPISPRSELPLVRLASISLRSHDAASSANWARRALALAPLSLEGHYLLGRASLESGDLPTAVAELQQAGRMSPDSPEIHFNLAKAYTRAKMPEKAEQERATFAALNARAELLRSQTGSQIYAGPRNANNLNQGVPAPRAE